MLKKAFANNLHGSIDHSDYKTDGKLLVIIGRQLIEVEGALVFSWIHASRMLIFDFDSLSA